MSASSSPSRAASLRSGFGRRRSSRLIRSLIFRQSSVGSEAAIPVTSSSAANYSAQSSHKKRQGLCGFRRPTWFFLAVLVVLLAAGHMAQAFDFFDVDCPDNSMRKPPRFGKRSPPVLDLAPGSTDLDQRTAPSRARRGAGSDCFRGPLRRRTLRQSTDASLPSMLNQLNVALLRNLMRQSANSRLDRARRVSEQPAYVAFEQEEPAPPAEILVVPSSSSMRLLDQDSPQQQQDAKPVLDLRQFILERAKARAKKDTASQATKDTSAGSASTEQ